MVCMPSDPPVDAGAWMRELYDCLHDLAARALRHEQRAITLQPTVLVHEAYLRLAGASVVIEDEAHFLALAARTVRRVLVDHARTREAQKRGGAWKRITMHPTQDWSTSGDSEPLDLLALDEALLKLETKNARAARVVELLFFSGLSIDETAQALEVSATTVDVDWRFAKAWLGRELEGK